MGDDANSFSLPVHNGQIIFQFLGWRVVLDEVYGCLGECPLQMSIADLGAAGPFFLPADSWLHFTRRQ